MKGIVNIEFVLSVMVFLSTVSFVTFVIINNIPTMHHEAVSDHIKARAYEISHMLIFDTGNPANWDESNVRKIGLSSGKPYELSSEKITNLNDLCSNSPSWIKTMLTEPGIFVDIKIKNIKNNLQLTPDCSINETGVKFMITRFALVGSDIARVEVTVIAK